MSISACPTVTGKTRKLIGIQDPPESIFGLEVDQRFHALRRPSECVLAWGGRVELRQRTSEQHRERLAERLAVFARQFLRFGLADSEG